METRDVPKATGEARLAVVIFSKDRACQLLCSLVSLLRHLRGVTLDVSVLYKASQPSFAESYRVVEELLGKQLYPSHGNVIWHWMEETVENTLGNLLDSVLARVRGEVAAVLLTVDDALWYRDFNVAAALQLLHSDDRVYAVHAKLSPRVEYAHPNNKFMRVPSFSPYMAPVPDDFLAPELLTFEREKGEYDWNYPWELSASLYRLESVEEVLNSIRSEFGSAAVDHPNHLEGYGVRLLKQKKLPGAEHRVLCACLSEPVVAVVTINRVQSLFENPIYSQSNGLEISVEELDHVLRYSLLRSLDQGQGGQGPVEAAAELAKRLGWPADWWISYLKVAENLALQPWTRSLDLTPGWPPQLFAKVAEMYSERYLDSVHVPLPPMTSRDLQEPSEPSEPSELMVSWLMPVKDTPAAWLALALDSIQQQEAMAPGSWELIVVDDGSTQLETKETLAAWAQQPFIQVIGGTASGIACALNEGWKRCRGRYVARLDGDDCAHPQRLKKQIRFLERHPSIAILGGGFCTFEDHDPRNLPPSALKRYRMPCHPILAKWRMVFSCSLAHPCVTFRRAVFEKGPYPEGREAEDHWCWLSLPLQLPLANLADVLCFLRRHGASRSAQAAERLQRSSHEAVRHFVAQETQVELEKADVKVLWGKTADSAEQVERVSKALDALEAVFLKLVGEGTDRPVGDGFDEDFLGVRRAALQEYVASSCSRLRGALAMQSLASGEVDVGAAMMKHWLKGGDAGLKSLGALIQSGYSTQS